MGEHYRHLKYEDRVIISIRLKDKWPVAKIAQEIGVSRKTIYNEIKRAGYMHRNTDWTEEYRYDPDLAQKDYDWKQSAKGSKLKIDDDHELSRVAHGLSGVTGAHALAHHGDEGEISK